MDASLERKCLVRKCDSGTQYAMPQKNGRWDSDESVK